MAGLLEDPSRVTTENKPRTIVAGHRAHCVTFCFFYRFYYDHVYPTTHFLETQFLTPGKWPETRDNHARVSGNGVPEHAWRVSVHRVRVRGPSRRR